MDAPPPNPAAPAAAAVPRRAALAFVVLIGVVSLFADMTYEGARSITGPYLAILGASGTVVGVVAGLGELLGYGLRLASGYVADRTGRYWPVTLLGYVVNLLAVPLLALAGRWELAAALIIAERVGKAIRTPARDAMLAHATTAVGRGWGFGLHEALDQGGAVLGPVVVALVLARGHPHATAFAVLLVPALLALAVLLLAWRLYPSPRELEARQAAPEAKGLARPFWLYLAAAALVAAGYVDFPLIAFHFERAGAVEGQWIPWLYALAMAVDAVAALVLGRLFDRFGLPVLGVITLVSASFAPLVFFGGLGTAILGMCLWGIGMGAQESIMRAAVASMVPAARRATAYGVFNAGYGVAWFLGSALMGVLYDVSLPALVAFSVVAQVVAAPLLLRVRLARG